MNNFYKDVHFDIPQGYYLHGVESVHDHTYYKRQYARYRVVNAFCLRYNTIRSLFMHAVLFHYYKSIYKKKKTKKSDLAIALGPWDTNMQCIYKVMLIELLTRLHTIAIKLV